MPLKPSFYWHDYETFGADPACDRPSQFAGVRTDAELEEIVRRTGARIAVLTTPAAAAQQAADRLIAQGVTSILNFAPTVLSVPDGVDVRKVDLSIELQILAYHEQRKAVAPGTEVVS